MEEKNNCTVVVEKYHANMYFCACLTKIGGQRPVFCALAGLTSVTVCHKTKLKVKSEIAHVRRAKKMYKVKSVTPSAGHGRKTGCSPPSKKL